MHTRAAYLLAAVFFFAAAASWAALPPNGYLDNEVRLDEDYRLHGQPFNDKEADKIVVTDEDRSADVWALGYIPELIGRTTPRPGDFRWVLFGPAR
jgi:hypothetical protein